MKTRIKVLLLWRPADNLLNYFKKKLADWENIVLLIPPNKDKEEVKKYCEEKAPTVEVIVGWRPTTKLLEQAGRLQVFINPGTGVKHHIKAFKQIYLDKNIVLLNGHGHAHHSAQHALALLLSLSNKIVMHHQFMQAGKWRTGDKEGASTLLHNRVIGLAGYGAINQLVHKYLSPFDPQFAILHRDPQKRLSNLLSSAHVFTTEQLHSFLQMIDTLIIAMPHTKLTENLFAQKELSLLGRKGLLVNVGRGAIVNQHDLYDALSKNTIAGAALDVWYDYKAKPNKDGQCFPYDYPFQELSNVVLSPHRAASPMNELARWDNVIDNLIAYSEKRPLNNIVSLSEEY